MPRAESLARAALLVALVVAVYAPSLANGFVSDDSVHFGDLPSLASLTGLRDVWLRLGAVPQYYPLVHTAFWIEHRLWGLDPLGYHAMNLVTHAASVILAWRLLARLAVPGAWLAAALWAVHPVQVESVAWASERKNLLSAVFAFASMLAYLRFAPLDESAPRPGRRRAWALSLALFAAALLCKTVTVTTPAVLLVVRWWRRGVLRWRDLRPLVPHFALGVPLALVTVWVERVHVGATGAAWELAPVERMLVAGRAVWFYAAKLAWPHPLGFVYPRWRLDAGDPLQIAAPLALVALALALFALRPRIGRAPLATLLLYAGVLFPALGFFDVYPFLFSYVADHYQYHASLAPLALAAAGLATLALRWRGAWIAAAAWVAVLGALAHHETRFYRDDATLIRRSAESQPDSWAARHRLGAVYQNERRFDDAVAEMRAALALFPEHAPIRVGIATNLASLGRLAEADAELVRALEGSLDAEQRVAASIQLGNLRVAQGHFAESIAPLRAAVALDPRSAEAQYTLGLALRMTRDGEGAQAALEQAVTLAPDVAKSQYALGLVRLEHGDAAGALAPLAEAVRLAPENATYRERLELAQSQAGGRSPALP